MTRCLAPGVVPGLAVCWCRLQNSRPNHESVASESEMLFTFGKPFRGRGAHVLFLRVCVEGWRRFLAPGLGRQPSELLCPRCVRTWVRLQMHHPGG